MSEEEIKTAFGFDPETIGLRYRAHWVIEELDDDDIEVDAKPGYLVVRARDGGSNPPDPDAFRKPNYFATNLGWDVTYRHYYFKPIKETTHD